MTTFWTPGARGPQKSLPIWGNFGSKPLLGTSQKGVPGPLLGPLWDPSWETSISGSKSGLNGIFQNPLPASLENHGFAKNGLVPVQNRSKSDFWDPFLGPRTPKSDIPFWTPFGQYRPKITVRGP